MIGSLPSQVIRKMIKDGSIIHGSENNIQPASLDLTISDTVYRMRGTFLPRENESIESFFNESVLYKTDINQPLELFGIYLIKVNEELRLPEDVYAYHNNKSTTGRINLQSRLLANGVSQFDHIPRGYSGNLWIEVIPKSFPVKLFKGAKLSQIRFFNGDTKLDRVELEKVYARHQLLFDKNGKSIPQTNSMFTGHGLTLTADLEHDIIGYKCFPSSNKFLDFSVENKLSPEDYFEPIYRPKNGKLCLRRDEFYILFTKEYLRVPITYAAEMVAYDPSKGEFRSHYAGFFDPGWGYGKTGSVKGAPAVLEVCSHDNDFIIRDRQPICKMIYEKVLEAPDIIYGTDKAQSHYMLQSGPRLSKHFIV